MLTGRTEVGVVFLGVLWGLTGCAAVPAPFESQLEDVPGEKIDPASCSLDALPAAYDVRSTFDLRGVVNDFRRELEAPSEEVPIVYLTELGAEAEPDAVERLSRSDFRASYDVWDEVLRVRSARFGRALFRVSDYLDDALGKVVLMSTIDLGTGRRHLDELRYRVLRYDYQTYPLGVDAALHAERDADTLSFESPLGTDLMPALITKLVTTIFPVPEGTDSDLAPSAIMEFLFGPCDAIELDASVITWEEAHGICTAAKARFRELLERAFEPVEREASLVEQGFLEVTGTTGCSVRGPLGGLHALLTGDGEAPVARIVVGSYEAVGEVELIEPLSRESDR